MTKSRPTFKVGGMGKLSRTKGHSFERFIARCFRIVGFENAKRQLEYQIDSCQGIDLAETGPFRVQCKKTKKYVSMNTIKEVKIKDPTTEVPVLIAQGDREEPLVTLPLASFLWLLDSNLLTLAEIQQQIEKIKKGGLE